MKSGQVIRPWDIPAAMIEILLFSGFHLAAITCPLFIAWKVVESVQPLPRLEAVGLVAVSVVLTGSMLANYLRVVWRALSHRHRPAEAVEARAG